MFTIFSCSISVTVKSQKGVPSFHLHQKAYVLGFFTELKLSYHHVCYIEMVKNV